MRKNLKYIACCLLLSACSPGYVLRAAYEETKILANRVDIKEGLAENTFTPEEAEKLKVVMEAREFAIEIGLTLRDSFTKYTKIDKDVLSWVVMGSKKDAFELHTWWFPFVGSVPYKGYFEREDADETAKDLEDQGYETWVRGTDAFSTLGWFNDPILSTTLKHSIPELVETVIHESVHATVWFPGSVPFNESLAQFIGMHGTKAFFEKKLTECQNKECIDRVTPFVAYATQTIERSKEFSKQLEILYTELEALYQSEIPSEEKIHKREVVFERAMVPIRKKFPHLKNFDKVNNAKIMQSRIYYMKYGYFEEEFAKSQQNLFTFIESYKKLNETKADAPW